MKASKPASLRELPVSELEVKLREAKENFFKMQLRKETRQMDDLVAVRVARRDIARLLTVLTQKKKPAESKSVAKGVKA